MLRKNVLSFILIVLHVIIVGCTVKMDREKDNKTDTLQTDSTKYVYSCPMKCEGDITYSKPGKCPVCGMKLEQKLKSK